jgi:SOS-response transcriptional repressor LexA
MKIAQQYDVTIDYLMGFSDEPQQYADNKKAPPLSDGARKIANDYDRLDHHGRAAIRGLMDEELNRMETLERLANMDALELVPEPKVVNLFDNPAAAGLALDMTGQGCTPYELQVNDPQGASYAIRVQGNSMEPAFEDGDIAFVNHDAMRDGDIGVFCVDGATVIKQWHYDHVLGITYLFSLNRERSDADLCITANSSRTIVWQGRVITKRRYPVPGL